MKLLGKEAIHIAEELLRGESAYEFVGQNKRSDLMRWVNDVGIFQNHCTDWSVDYESRHTCQKIPENNAEPLGVELDH